MKKTAIKFISTLLCLASIFALTFSVASASSAYKCERWLKWGDLTNNNTVEAADARLALRASANLEKLDEDQKYAADVNRDGKLTATDARQILRVSARIDTFKVNVELKAGQEYVIDSVYDSGAYVWNCTVSPKDGLDVTETLIESETGFLPGQSAERVYTFTAKMPGIYEVNFKLTHVGATSDVIDEITYIFTVG